MEKRGFSRTPTAPPRAAARLGAPRTLALRKVASGATNDKRPFSNDAAGADEILACRRRELAFKIERRVVSRNAFVFSIGKSLQCGTTTLSLEKPLIMGIVNVTPDSFSDGGDFVDAATAIKHGIQLIEEGAGIVDVGGESTRPGAESVSLETELARVIPVIEGLRDYIEANAQDVVISVDTYKPEVMRAAAEAGAGMINDVRALTEEGALDAAASMGLPVVLMHSKGDFATMQDDPYYDDVVGEVHRFLTERVFACELAGIDKKKIVVDPGFGFAKNTQHNLELLAQLERFATIGVPLLAGLSRKRTIGEVTERKDAKDRVFGSVAAHLIAVQNGASIVRVHDVAATRDALKVLEAVKPFVLVRRDDAKPAISWPDD